MIYKTVLKIKAAIAAISVMLLACFTLISCVGSSEGAESGEDVTFTDALGREVKVKSTERAAALLGSFADVWVLSGGELCAAADDAWEDFGLSLDGAVNIGGAHSPSLELLLSANPDFVLASASTAADVEMKDTLESLGITVAYFEVDNFYDYLAMLDICTSITGRRDLYEKNGVEIKAKIDFVKERYAALGIPEQERRALLLRASSSSLKAKGSEGTVLGEMLADMGCINIADSDKSLLENLSAEAIIKNEPYHVFVVTMGNSTEKAIEAFKNTVEENPAFSTLSAFREGRVYIMDKTLFNLKPNARWAHSYEILYEKLTEK